MRGVLQVRVLLECCGQEGVFNRFYALLASRLCESYREVRFAMHFAFHDEFGQLGDVSLHRAANTAKLLAHLVQHEVLPATVLKVVRWHGLPPRAVFFWQVFFVELLCAPARAQRAAMLPLREPASAELRDGIVVFLVQHVQRTVNKQQPELSTALQALMDSLDVV